MISFQCRSIWFMVPSFIMEIILVLLVLLCFVFACFQFCSNHAPQIHNSIKYFCIITEFLCFIAIGGLSLLLFWYTECTQGGVDSTPGSISGTLGFLCYSFTLTAIYSIFAFRVYWSFVGSIYKLSSKIVKMLIIVLIIQLTVNITAISSYFIKKSVGLALTSLTFVKYLYLCMRCILILILVFLRNNSQLCTCLYVCSYLD